MSNSNEIHFPTCLNLIVSSTPSSILVHDRYVIFGTRHGVLTSIDVSKLIRSKEISKSRISCLGVMKETRVLVAVDVRGGLSLVDLKSFETVRNVSVPNGVSKMIVGDGIVYVATSRRVYSIRLDTKAEVVLLHSSLTPIVAISLSSGSVVVSLAEGEHIRLDDKFNTDTDRSSSSYVDEGTKWLRRSRSQRRPPPGSASQRSHTVSGTRMSSPAKPSASSRIRDSSSLLTPAMDMMDDMIPQSSTDIDEIDQDKDSVSSKSSSNSSNDVVSSSLCITATSFKNLYAEATIHDTGSVRLVLMSSSSKSEVAHTLNATLTDADRLLMDLERKNRHRKNRKMLAPWLPKLCTSGPLLCACTSSGSVYFIASDFRSYRFEYGTSVCDFAMSRSTFFGDDSFVLALVPRNSRRIEVFRLVNFASMR